jgi:uncharacterized hydrophobic protein (TIGR00271 family)
MLDLKVSGESADMARVAARLDAITGTAQVCVLDTVRPGRSVVRADVAHDSVDEVLDELELLAVPARSISIARIELVGQLAGRKADTSLVWADVVGVAGTNARLVGRYLAFMVVAGVVGCYGVIDRNPMLIVGAMAVSPDLLPIAAIAVGAVGRDRGLAGRALLTLVVGLAVAGIVAALLTLLQNELDLIPASFDIDNTVLQSLATVGDETIVVALFAGIAGMLAIETRASAGVGVAISVTTIPAAAYFGIALGLGQAGEATGALAVLAVNVLCLIIGAAGTLLVQRRHVLERRSTLGDAGSADRVVDRGDGGHVGGMGS